MMQGSADARTGPDSDEPRPVVLFIVDLSGSMNAPFGPDGTRLDVAKASLEEAFQRVSEDAEIGLRVYGDLFPSLPPEQRQQNCEEDTRLVVPIERGARDEILNAVESFEARGDTPIGLALERAAEDIPDFTDATVVLFSDGRDECHDANLSGDPDDGPSWGPDPCEKARELVERGAALGTGIDRIETVGFVADEHAERELRCIAEETGGTYTPIQTPEDAADILPDLLAELGNPRGALRLGGVPIEGTPGPEGAPRLGRISDPAENVLRYTDTITFGEERWYRAARYGPSGGNTTVTVFGLPAVEGIVLSLRGEGGPDDDRIPRIERSHENAGIPRAPAVSVRCPDCGWRGVGDDISPYWVVSLDGDAPVTGTFDLELSLEGPAWGGVPMGCGEGQRCFYEAAVDERKRQINELRSQLDNGDGAQTATDEDGGDDLDAPTADLVRLEATVEDLREHREQLAALAEPGSNWTPPLALLVVALLAEIGRTILTRSRAGNGATEDPG